MSLEPTQKRLSISILLLYLIVAIIVLIPIVSSAKSWYIRPRAEIPLRSGKGQEYRIVSILKEGSQVKLLQEDGAWARVETGANKEGWILKRYLSSSPPLEDLVARLKASKTRAERQAADISKKLDEVSSASKQCSHDLEACIQERDQIKKAYEALKIDASDTIQLRRSVSETGRQLQEIRQRLLAAEEENRHLKNMERIKWFLAGGGVFVSGWIIGLITGRGRRHKTLVL